MSRVWLEEIRDDSSNPPIRQTNASDTWNLFEQRVWWNDSMGARANRAGKQGRPRELRLARAGGQNRSAAPSGRE